MVLGRLSSRVLWGKEAVALVLYRIVCRQAGCVSVCVSEYVCVCGKGYRLHPSRQLC